MTDHPTTDHDGIDDEPNRRVEELLREIDPADSELLDVPDDLWGRIALEIAGDDRVVSLDSRRHLSMRSAVLGAAAAAIVMVVGSMAVITLGNDGGSKIVANADLAFDPQHFDPLGADSTAHATLVDDDGRFRVELDESDLPSAAGQSADLELWLIQPDADGNPADLVSLGLIDPARPAEFDVPPSYDPNVFYVVDISVEPRDGDSSHSGRSILRGPLTDA
jgi:anti-sigma-K factor RskA